MSVQCLCYARPTAGAGLRQWGSHRFPLSWAVPWREPPAPRHRESCPWTVSSPALGRLPVSLSDLFLGAKSVSEPRTGPSPWGGEALKARPVSTGGKVSRESLQYTLRAWGRLNGNLGVRPKDLRGRCVLRPFCSGTGLRGVRLEGAQALEGY